MRNYTARIPKPYVMMPKHKLIIKWLRHKGSLTNSWEKGFLLDIKNKQKLSLRQLAKIMQIYNQHRFGIRDYQPIICKSDYGYIHDFS